MKKALSILIIALLIFNSGGYYFIFLQLQNCFKQLAQNKIDDYIPLENLILIKVNKKSSFENHVDVFERLNDEEFKYYGKMYDIYKEEENGDTVFFYCVSDENEDVILKAFTDYASNFNDINLNPIIKNIIKTFITNAIQSSLLVYKYYSSRLKISYYYQNLYDDIFLDIPSPPPKS